MSDYTSFNNRETYLSKVEEWRDDYRYLTENIREAKKTNKERQRSGKTYERYPLYSYKNDANQMLGIRQEMKIRASEQWAAQRT